MNIYSTSDGVGNRIKENATIRAYESDVAAIADLLKGYSPDEWDYSTARLVAGTWGDCWIKSYAPLEDISHEPFSKDELIVMKSGTHPGGDGLWITPSPDVFILKIDSKEEVE